MSDCKQDLISEISHLNQRVGFLEGLLFNLELLDDSELNAAIKRGADRYQQILASHDFGDDREAIHEKHNPKTKKGK